MAQDPTQSLILPPCSLLVTPFRSNLPYARPPQPPVGVEETRQQSASNAANHLHLMSNRPLLVQNNGTGEMQYHDFQVVSFDDLIKLFPDPKPTTRIEVGLLPDGSAYAPKSATREQYLLFPSKSSYIIYFTDHYFSIENLSRDSYFRRMLINGRFIPLDTLTEAPRLKAINATSEEVARALAQSKVVCVQDMEDGVRGVCRREPIQASTEPNWMTTPYGSLYDSQAHATHLADKSVLVQSSVATQGNEGDGNLERRPVSNLSSEMIPTPNVFISNFGIPPIEPSIYSANVKDINPIMSSSGTANPSSNTTTPDISSAPNSTPHNPSGSPGRFSTSLWPNHQPGMLSANSYSSYPVVSHQSLVVDPSAVAFNHAFAVNQHVNPGFQLGGIQPSDLSHASVLPLRQSPAFGQFILNQGGQPIGGYASAMSQSPASGSPINFALAAALPSQSPQLTSSPGFGSALFAGHPNALAALSPNQANAALAAAYAAVAQQQHQAAYIHSGLTSNMHSQANPFQPTTIGQSTFPFYCAPPLHFPAQLPRHPVQRISHAPIYPISAYSFQPTVLQTAQVSPELVVPSAKVESGVPLAATSNVNHGSSGLTYPLLFQHHLPIQPLGNPSYHPNAVDSGLALAASGLHIQRCAPPARPNSFGLGHLPVAVTMINVPRQTATDNGVTYAKPDLANNGLDGSIHSDDNAFIDKSNEEITAFDGSVSQSASHNVLVPTSTTHKCLTGSKCESSPRADISSEDVGEGKPIRFSSTDDSEDSASSGIGEMTSVCSSSTSDARATSSCTLTDQAIRSDGYTLTSCRQPVLSNRAQELLPEP